MKNKMKVFGLVGLTTSLLFATISIDAKDLSEPIKPVPVVDTEKNKITIEEKVKKDGVSTVYATVEDSLNIRKRPSIESEIETYVLNGEELDFYRAYPLDESWSAILYNGELKYVASDFISEEPAATANEQSDVVEYEEESIPEVIIIPQEEEVYIESESEPIVEEPAAQETYTEPEPEYVEPEPEQPSYSETYLGSYYITHYCNCSICCGQWAGGGTASGTYPTSWHTIATGSEFGFGTQLMINGTVYTVEDRGVGNGCIDIYCDSHEEALSRGAYYADVYLVG